MLHSKRFSVIMPVYNGENFIKKALQSLVENLSVNDELIVIDDKSTDNTENIIKKFLGRKINYKIIKLNKNVGVTRARNIGIKIANGKFITFLDHDDYYPNKKRLANHLKIFNKHKHIDIVRGYAKYFFMNKKLLKLYHQEKNINVTPSGVIKNSELLGALSFRKEVFEKIKFNNKFKDGEDTDLCIKLKMYGYKFYNQRVLALRYRIHGMNMTLTKKYSIYSENYSKKKKIKQERKLILKSIIHNFKNRKKFI
jgi:glycosyltransferase involved in cell wall biosynthesis